MEEHTKGMAGEEQKTSQYASRGGVEQEEIGRDESWFNSVRTTFDAWFANIKRTYDEYQQESLDTIRQNRTMVAKIVSDAQQFDNQRQVLANHALELAISRDNMAQTNTLESNNMVAKQAIRHSDIAIDRQWNVDEVAKFVTDSQVFTNAVQAAVAKEVNKPA